MPGKSTACLQTLVLLKKKQRKHAHPYSKCVFSLAEKRVLNSFPFLHEKACTLRLADVSNPYKRGVCVMINDFFSSLKYKKSWKRMDWTGLGNKSNTIIACKPRSLRSTRRASITTVMKNRLTTRLSTTTVGKEKAKVIQQEGLLDKVGSCPYRRPWWLRTGWTRARCWFDTCTTHCRPLWHFRCGNTTRGCPRGSKTFVCLWL